MSLIDVSISTGYVEWMEEGYCRRSGAPDLWHGETPAETVRAKQLCLAKCPVVSKCLKHALDNGEVWGVWGGMSPADRTQLTGGTKSCAKNHPGEPPEPVTRSSGVKRCKACMRAYDARRAA